MRHVGIRGRLAAITFAFVLCSITSPAHAQQTEELADPELAAKGVWNPSTNYLKDDIVTARGSAWIAKRNNKGKVPGQTSPSSARDWQLFARGFNPTGVWLNTTRYQPDDLVVHNGQTYRAKRTIAPPGAAPSAGANWELFAAKGAPGPNTGIGAGTQGAPSISFNGDSNTGIYSPATGKVAIVGDGALFLHNLGGENTALGKSALMNTNSAGNTAVGHETLMSNDGGNSNTAVGAFALTSNISGSQNTAVGESALWDNTGSSNTGVGNLALAKGTGSQNSAMGMQTLINLTSGSFNTAVGSEALINTTTGNENVAVGYGALPHAATTNNNVGIGAFAGSNVSNPSDSIFIGNQGLGGDTTTIKIGTQGTQTTAFIAGIRGVTTTAADAIPVLISSTGQLGTTSSSRRYKYDIETMADASALLAKLRPVTFRYKQAQDSGQHPLQYGLIAEEVADVFPDLAVFNEDGQPETVKYHLLPSFLLAGYLAQQKTIDAQADEIVELKQRLAAIEAMLPRTTKAASR